jgi:BCD family chlorophyll transporter-like MFS transporter
MIVELNVPASMVGIMLALPLLFAPFRALIGFRSDNHKCALGWRRVPFIYRGTLLQFGGFAMMPFALLVLAGAGDSSSLPIWVGHVSAALAFLLVGAGIHTVQTAGLALATDLTPQKSHPKVVGLMYVMLLLGMLISSLCFGAALNEYTPARLVQVIQTAALLTVILNGVALWKQEPRHSAKTNTTHEKDHSFRDAWRSFCLGTNTKRRLIIIGLGTMAFGMADILLEPFGGHVLNLSVSATTKLTAILAAGGLLGFAYASNASTRGTNAYKVARNGALIGIPAFICVIAAAPLHLPILFLAGNFLIGFGGALFAHGTLTATMNHAPSHQVGLALGSWGAMQATAAGLGIAASGIIRDLVNAMQPAAIIPELGSIANGYISVYVIETLLLVLTVMITLPLIRNELKTRSLESSTFCGNAKIPKPNNS